MPRNLLGPEDNPKPFTSDNQPSREAKSLGQKKRKFNRIMMREMLSGSFTFKSDSLAYQQLVENFGEEAVKEMCAGQLAFARQLQRAIHKVEPTSATLIFTQALGNPSQDIDLTTGGQKIQQPFNDEQTDKIIEALRANKNS